MLPARILTNRPGALPTSTRRINLRINASVSRLAKRIGVNLVGGVLCLTASAASASAPSLCAIMQPCTTPAQYASGPFLAEPMIRELTLRQVQVACGVGSAHAFKAASEFPFSVFGCSRLASNRCIVHVPKDVKAISASLFEEILQHELAHCRGWVHARY